MTTKLYLLRDMPLNVAAAGVHTPGATPMLLRPAPVFVTFDYTPAIDAVLTLSNGDPGDEPGSPEALTITSITSTLPLYFADDIDDVTVAMTAGPGFNLVGYMSQATLDAIEESLLADLASARREARLDAYLAQQP